MMGSVLQCVVIGGCRNSLYGVEEANGRGPTGFGESTELVRRRGDTRPEVVGPRPRAAVINSIWVSGRVAFHRRVAEVSKWS